MDITKSSWKLCLEKIKKIKIKTSKYSTEIEGCDSQNRCSRLFFPELEIKAGVKHTYEVIFSDGGDIVINPIKSPLNKVRIASNY